MDAGGRTTQEQLSRARVRGANQPADGRHIQLQEVDVGDLFLAPEYQAAISLYDASYSALATRPLKMGFSGPTN